MAERKKGYWLLFSLTVLLTLGALSTIVPSGSIGGINYLGYNAICPFAPFSTLVCLAAVALICIIRSEKLKIKDTEKEEN